MLYEAGYYARNLLQHHQASAQAAGIMPELAVKAYEEFVANANLYLEKVKNLGLPSLSPSPKGIRSTCIPEIGQALSKGSSGVHVRPHPLMPKNVTVECYRLSPHEEETIMMLARTFYESIGFRVGWL